MDGLGDTIRVSLTEDPWCEIDPCKRLVHFAKSYDGKGISAFEEVNRSIDSIVRRHVESAPHLHRDGSVILAVSAEEMRSETFFTDLGCLVQLGRPEKTQGSVDAVIAAEHSFKLTKLQEAGIGVITQPFVVSEEESQWAALLQQKPECIFFAPSCNYVHTARKFFEWPKIHQLKIPVILDFAYACSEQDMVIQASADLGALLCDGLGGGNRLELLFRWLLGARLPLPFCKVQGCVHLKQNSFPVLDVGGHSLIYKLWLPISVCVRPIYPVSKLPMMGCIVNGPGEMADADFGYVGSLPGKIDLYVGKERVEKNIPMEEAVEQLSLSSNCMAAGSSQKRR